jgi:hypothetical protein
MISRMTVLVARGMPQLVHLILDKEAVEQAGQQGEVCLALSGYVHRVLQTPEIPLATKTVILEIILYPLCQG